jgi:predicted nucleic acid-binding protein
MVRKRPRRITRRTGIAVGEAKRRRVTSFVLDTNIYDKIVERGITDDLLRLVAARRLRILTTHVQRDELEKIADVAKRQAVFRVPGQIVPTAAAVYGVSRYGHARYGEGGADGIDISAIQKGNPEHSEDALIAETAAYELTVIVTEDAQLANKVRAKASKTRVWDFQTFETYVTKLLSRLR